MPNVDDPSFPTNPQPDEAPTAPDLVPIAAGAAQRTVADAFTALATAMLRIPGGRDGRFQDDVTAGSDAT